MRAICPYFFGSGTENMVLRYDVEKVNTNSLFVGLIEVGQKILFNDLY